MMTSFLSVANSLDLGSGEFRAPVAGLYQASFSVTLDTDIRHDIHDVNNTVPKFVFHTGGVNKSSVFHRQGLLASWLMPLTFSSLGRR